MCNLVAWNLYISLGFFFFNLSSKGRHLCKFCKNWWAGLISLHVIIILWNVSWMAPLPQEFHNNKYSLMVKNHSTLITRNCSSTFSQFTWLFTVVTSFSKTILLILHNLSCSDITYSPQCKQWQVNDSIDTFELLILLQAVTVPRHHQSLSASIESSTHSETLLQDNFKHIDKTTAITLISDEWVYFAELRGLLTTKTESVWSKAFHLQPGWKKFTLRTYEIPELTGFMLKSHIQIKSIYYISCNNNYSL